MKTGCNVRKWSKNSIQLTRSNYSRIILVIVFFFSSVMTDDVIKLPAKLMAKKMIYILTSEFLVHISNFHEFFIVQLKKTQTIFSLFE